MFSMCQKLEVFDCDMVKSLQTCDVYLMGFTRLGLRKLPVFVMLGLGFVERVGFLVNGQLVFKTWYLRFVFKFQREFVEVCLRRCLRYGIAVGVFLRAVLVQLLYGVVGFPFTVGLRGCINIGCVG